MKYKIVTIILIFILLITVKVTSIGLTNKILINDETFTFVEPKDRISSDFDSNYEISINNENEDEELNKVITELTKKTTYLLIGEPNAKKESSADYYKRHKDYLNLRYNPIVPKDSSSYLGLDENSQEYRDDVLSGISVPGMFLKLQEFQIKYNDYGEIRIANANNNMILSMITLTNITLKVQDENNPMEYKNVKTNLTLYYYYKQLNNEYKLIYLYGETDDDIQEYLEKTNEKSGELVQNVDYNSTLRDIYDFTKSDEIKEEALQTIYNENKNKIVFLNSTYNTGIVTSANGFFINKNLIVTTYNYIEKSLMKAQKIIISDTLGNVYDLEGIVTVNVDNDLAILKVKNDAQDCFEQIQTNNLKKEDAVIALNSQTGIGVSVSKGIIIVDGINMQTSLPITEEIQGSPIFNQDGILVGMLNSKSLNTSLSYITKSNVLNKYYDKFKNNNNVKSISFDKLKEDYYIKYNEEKITNNIPQNKWKQYSKAENIDELISLKLIKASYKDGIISLRYKNEALNYIDTMEFASQYKENLKSKGYNENIVSKFKAIYQNDNYQIIIMSEFDYLIVIMVKV